MNTKADIFASRSPMRWAASALVAVLAGCAWLQPDDATPEPVHELLAELHRFVAADAAARAEAYAAAVATLAVEPGPRAQLRVAMLQAWPGHAHSRPDQATHLLESVVADPDAADEDRDLAQVMSHWIAQRGIDQRLRRSLQSRIAALERELAETREQLSALAEIERMVEPDLCNPESGDDCPQDRTDPAR